MQSVQEPLLTAKISQFLQRKSRQFPELELRNHWDDYEYTSDSPLDGKTNRNN